MWLRRARLDSAEALVDLRLEGGLIVDVVPSYIETDVRTGELRPPLADAFAHWSRAAGEASAAVALDVDLGGALVLPALVNGHAHLDKTFVGAAWQPHRPGRTVVERVAAERAVRREVEAGIADRAELLATRLIGYGAGLVRTHVDIDTELGLAALEVVLELRERLADVLTLQVVAFPQSGILADPGVDVLLKEAVLLGADVVGGLDPLSFDGDLDAHLDQVFGLAVDHDVDVDIHLHDLGPGALVQYREICARTVAAGLRGRVAISHAYGLGSVSLDDARRAGVELAAAGVAIMTNGPAGPMPPVLELRAEGTVVFSGSDNVRDAWWPYGSGDPLDVARGVAYQSDLRTDAELEVALDLVGGAARTALGERPVTVAPGMPADLVLLPPGPPAAAVAAPPTDRVVLRRGRPISATTTDSWNHARPATRPAHPDQPSSVGTPTAPSDQHL